MLDDASSLTVIAGFTGRLDSIPRTRPGSSSDHRLRFDDFGQDAIGRHPRQNVANLVPQVDRLARRSCAREVLDGESARSTSRSAETRRCRIYSEMRSRRANGESRRIAS